MIVASAPGRMRIKLPASHTTGLAALQVQLQQLEGVMDVVLHLASRSLIMRYARSCPANDMERQVQALLPAVAQTPSGAANAGQRLRLIRGVKKASLRRSVNRWAKVAALISLPLSIALVYAGHKRWHAITGWGFVGAAVTHMYIHRKNTFR